MHKELLGKSHDALLELAPTATHQHYKGGLYRFLGEGIHTETQEELVFYQHVFPYDSAFYARPKSMFYDMSSVTSQRFTPLK